MATLVLSTVGTIFGGPLGGAIGGFIGSQFDQAVIGNGPDREGARLAEVSVQTSSYGTAIPQIFGNMRTAGSVIWATDLQEDSNREGGGKGRPSTVTFSYSANFAVALSSRPIAAIGRIWADGNLLRGVQGDFKSETQFRYYTGSEDQPIDPLIASAEGIANTPAHRGISYAVFENMQLENFGNRIPSLTFEIINVFGQIEILSIARELTQGLVGSNQDENQGLSILGFAAAHSNSREAIETLIAPLPLSLRAKGLNLELIAYSNQETIDIDSPQAALQNDNRLEDKQISVLPIGEIPKQYALRYYDPAREYQAGLQNSTRPGPGRENVTTDFPAALKATDASAIVRNKQNQDILARKSLSLNLVRAVENYHSGDIVRFLGHTNIWQIIQIEQDLGLLTLELRAISEDAVTLRTSNVSSGRSIVSRDEQAGETIFHLLDLPAFNIGNALQPNIAIASAGTESGWRSATIFSREGSNITPIDSVNRVSNIGQVTEALKPAAAYLIDYANRPQIKLLHDDMSLPLSGPTGNVYFEAPHYAMIGDEIIAFSSARLNDDDSYTLEGLCRGIGGTEEYIGSHSKGERFILLDAQQLKFLDSSNYNLGQGLNLEAVGLNDEVPQPAHLRIIGRSLTPLSPVHGTITDRYDGGKSIRWIRRSRVASQWSDGVDIALQEDSEQYALQITSDQMAGTAQLLIDLFIANPEYEVSPDQLQQWINLGVSKIIISVIQVGTFARSAPLIFSHNIL